MSELSDAATRFEHDPYGAVDPKTGVSDARTLAYAYLAEHPADEDDAVTEDWLRMSGFYDDSPGHFGHLRNAAGVHIRHDGQVFWLSTIVTNATLYLPTRGHLRRLLTSLGFPS